MAIQNFPAALQPIIQQNYLEREFTEGLCARVGYRAIADRERFPGQIGETLTKTRKGLKAPVTSPISPSSNTTLDNGLTSSGWSIEQYTLAINLYADTIDLNMVTQGVGIEDQFLANARTNGIQAATSLDLLARNALFGFATTSSGFALPSGGGYMAGNTRVRLASTGTSVSVDDIRGFQYVYVNGVLTAVSSSNTLPITIGGPNGDVYTVIAATADSASTNASTAPNGVSGVLTLQGSGIPSTGTGSTDGAVGNAVQASTASVIIRPNSRLTTANLASGDTLFMQTVLAAVATLRSNNVPPVKASGLYHCYLDDKQLLGLFADPDFKMLYRGAYGSETYRSGQIFDLLGVRFISNNMAPQQSLSSLAIHRAIVCGQGALIEGNYGDTGYSDVEGDASLKVMVDDVCMVTRAPIDRLQQTIAQSWYWIGGFVVPTDITATSSIIPTATSSNYKRAVIIESL